MNYQYVCNLLISTQGEDESENEGEDEDEKRRQKRKRTRRLRIENKVKHGGRLHDIASSYETM